MYYYPKISIIIPFFNRIYLTLESIQSVLAQTYRNWELLLINDGSTEDLLPINQLIQGHPSIKLISIAHSGCAAAKNTGLYYATGDYIAFLDSDDLFKPTKLEQQLYYMLNYNCQFSHTSYDEISLGGQYIQTQHSGRLQGWVLPTIRTACPIATPTVMIKRTALLNKSFVPQYRIAEDICFWMDMNYEYPLGGIDTALSFVRVSSLSSKSDTAKQAEGQRNVFEHLRLHPQYNY